MKRLILTEKPSVASDFAKALHVRERTSSCYEGPDHIITWAFGHLLELCPPEDYSPKWKKWDFSTLPILPDEIRYRPIERNAQHLAAVLRHLQRSDVSEIIVATDAGREGELIARLLLTQAKLVQKPVWRFWTGLALTPDVIHKTLAQLKPWREFQPLYYAGKARQIADWLIGINLSRAATLKLGELYSVGRVQTAVLSFLVDRKAEREQFSAKPFFHLEAHFKNQKGEWRGLWFEKSKSKDQDKNQKDKNKEKESDNESDSQHRLRSKADAEKLAQNLSPHSCGAVISVKETPQTLPSPQLYSLTELQRDANNYFHFTAQQTLTLAQDLYEKKKCLSYPRTDARVLGQDNFGMVENLLQQFRQKSPELFTHIDQKLVSVKNTRVFNNAKVSDHHALIPLKPMTRELLATLNENEKKLFDLVVRRFAAVFHPPCRQQTTEVVTEIEKLHFKSRGTVIQDEGWTRLYHQLKDRRKSSGSGDTPVPLMLPPLKEKDAAQLSQWEILERTTQAPPEYTESSLLGQMSHPGQKVQEKELKSFFRSGDVGLGTESTRAQIIETLIDRQYAVRDKRKLKATDKGQTLVNFLRQLPCSQVLCTPEETARWELKLKKISDGEMNPLIFVEEMKEFVRSSLLEWQKQALPLISRPQISSTSPLSSSSSHSSQNQKLSSAKSSSDFSSGPLGPCPVCARPVEENKFSYLCSGKKEEKCQFVIQKTIASRPIAREVAERLLKTGMTPFIQGFRSKAGRPFKARLKLMPGEKGLVSVSFQFPEKSSSDKSERQRPAKARPSATPSSLSPSPEL